MAVKTRSQSTAMNKNNNGEMATGNGTTHISNGRKGTLRAGDTNYYRFKDYGVVRNIFHYTIVPLLIMILPPIATMVQWYTATHCNGSYQVMLRELAPKGILHGILHMHSHVHYFTPFAIKVLSGYALWAVFLMKILPGPRVEGPLAANGHLPVYKDNGFYCYTVTMVAFAFLQVALKQYGMSATAVYDNFGDLLATMNVVGLIFAAFLYVKGLYFPSNAEHGSSGNILFDYFWGLELYPRVWGIDIKVFTNCRWGMTLWPLLVMIYALKSYELYGFVDSMWVSCILQMVYCTKFFWWESGYMGTIDIMLDRAGFCICWGCLVFIAGFYASVSMYLVNNPVHLGPAVGVSILICGLMSIAVNYWADWQKQHVRRTQGRCKVWGEKPVIIRARYQDAHGDDKESILLASGYWGIARHFHYIPELALAFFWSLPALFENVMPYSYVIFLTGLLVQRTYRDDEKCRQKYTTYWSEYCEAVPYKMIPHVF